LIFKPVRALEENELKAALEMRDHADTVKAITLNVSQMDGVIPAPKGTLPMGELTKQEDGPAYEKIVAKTAPKPAKVEAEEVQEPIKVTKKAATPAAEKSDIADIVGDWDD
jgi:hypothetical protein